MSPTTEIRAFDDSRPTHHPAVTTQWTPITPLHDGGWLPRVVRRLVSLAHLPEDWDSYQSGAPEVHVLGRAIGLLDRMSEVGSWTPAPDVLPAPGGGIGLVWSAGSRELEILIDDEEIDFIQSEGDEVVGEGLVREALHLRDLLVWLADSPR